MMHNDIRTKAGQILGRKIGPTEDLAASIDEAIRETERLIKQSKSAQTSKVPASKPPSKTPSKGRATGAPEILTIRLMPRDRAALDELFAKARLASRAIGVDTTLSSYVRGLIRAEHRRVALGETPSPTAALVQQCTLPPGPPVTKVAKAPLSVEEEAEEYRLGVILAALRALRHQQGLPPERRHVPLYDHACFTLGRFLPDDEREQLARCYSQDGARGARKVVSGLLVRNSDRRLAVLRAKVAARG